MTLDLPRKVVLLGSGALKIGEAGEFDYSGSQCLKALEEEGSTRSSSTRTSRRCRPTSPGSGGSTSSRSSPSSWRRSSEEERPDGILLSFGGQTALNCGVQLADRGVLQTDRDAGAGNARSRGSRRPRTERSSCG